MGTIAYEKTGSADKPICGCGEDDLEIKPYYTGLAEFILDCHTPIYR